MRGMLYATNRAGIEQAARRIAPFVHRTPVLTCSALDRMAGRALFFKCENLQKVGAFKARGACNAVWSLPEGVRDVVTHSSCELRPGPGVGGSHAGASRAPGPQSCGVTFRTARSMRPVSASALSQTSSTQSPLAGLPLTFLRLYVFSMSSELPPNQ